MFLENELLFYLLLGAASVLFIICLVLTVIIIKLKKKIRKLRASGTDDLDTAILCRSCARMYSTSEKRCPHCGEKRGA